MNTPRHTRTWFSILSSFVLLACSISDWVLISNPTQQQVKTLPVAMVTFRVELPEPAIAGSKILLTVLDEVTGLAFNQQRFLMQAEDDRHFFTILPFPLGSIVKYRYSLEKEYLVQEHTSDGRQVRYRLLHVTNPMIVEDIVSRWTDTAFQLPAGRILGNITDQEDGHPIANILVAAGGLQTISSSDGSFILEGLPPGTHHLVVYSMDGAYQTFQQGAVVAGDSATEVHVQLRRADMVTVSFLVTAPENTPSFAPVRLAGNLTQLGNIFGELRGGVNLSARHLPVTTRLADGRYTLTLSLPVGTDIRYKYTLGDGVWNAEHTMDGKFQVRQLIVPDHNIIIEDTIETWLSWGIGAITLHVTVPPQTPPDEDISIQLNPGYGWMEPLPMWSMGSNQWLYTLYSPLESLPSVHYRFCRKDLCGSADESENAGLMATGRTFAPTEQAQVITDFVESWAWYPAPPNTAVVPSVAIQPRPDFMAGLAFQSSYYPAWASDYLPGLESAALIKANWVIFTPTWSVTRLSPPRFESLPAKDVSAPDMISLVQQARSRELNAALFPSLHNQESMADWYLRAPRDYSWWISWFGAYRRFILHHADLASQAGASALILGGIWVAPAVPNGALKDGSSANTPADADAFWRELIQEIRTKYNGILIWALPYPTGMQNIPAFLDQVDRIYLVWSAGIAQDGNTQVEQLSSQFAALLDRDILPLQQRFGKPIILSLAYPSVDGAAAGCLPASDGGCLDVTELDQPAPDQMQLTLDLEEQVQLYNAAFLAIQERSWITGLVSQGFFPFAPLQDKSASVNGKPALGVLWFWYPQLLGR